MSIRFRFSKNDLLKLFLICAAPVHFWALFVIISNVDLIGKRDLWYFGGYSGYLLGMALAVLCIHRELQETMDQADSRFRS
ncbi:MAG TPA: hypothetical protein VJ965_05805 [Anaerolineales bacterium]|nr:hypothetical protein [Anaerolineales bacterium]